jgi:hypothetical protein
VYLVNGFQNAVDRFTFRKGRMQMNEMALCLLLRIIKKPSAQILLIVFKFFEVVPETAQTIESKMGTPSFTTTTKKPPFSISAMAIARCRARSAACESFKAINTFLYRSPSNWVSGRRLHQGPNELQVREKLIILPLRGRVRCGTTLVQSCRDPEYPTHEWDFQDRPIPKSYREPSTIDEAD